MTATTKHTGTLEEAGRTEDEQDYEYKTTKWKDFFTKAKYITWHIVFLVITALTIYVTIHHDEIVEKIKPTSEKTRDVPARFLIPVAILTAISFPPLFGHELIALLCDVVYGLWPGFAIVAAGTFSGEIGTRYAFKYAFRRKAKKLEKTNLNYGALARVTREGGFLVVLIIRFSIIPAHFSTAVFSTANVKFIYFAIATFLTQPKQIILVYSGVLLVQQSTNNRINVVIFGVSFLTTTIAAVYIYKKMGKMKKLLMEEQQKRLNAKNDLEQDFSSEVTLEVDFGRTQSWNSTVKPSGPSPPRKARWQEGVYEMNERDDMGRNAKPTEFI